MQIKTICGSRNKDANLYRPLLIAVYFLLVGAWATGCDTRLGKALVTQVSTRQIDDELFKSCAKGDADKVKDLIVSGANVNATEAEGETPLMYASAEGQVQVIDILIDRGANIHAKSINGQTALGRAALFGHSSVVEKLLFRGAEIDEQMNDRGTPLMYAANVTTAKILLKYKANVNAKDQNGITPLIGAASNGKIEIVKVLIEAGANIDARDNNGKTALQWAKDHKQTDVVKFLENRN
jgi:ankyrin repeat protein